MVIDDYLQLPLSIYFPHEISIVSVDYEKSEPIVLESFLRSFSRESIWKEVWWLGQKIYMGSICWPSREFLKPWDHKIQANLTQYLALKAGRDHI